MLSFIFIGYNDDPVEDLHNIMKDCLHSVAVRIIKFQQGFCVFSQALIESHSNFLSSTLGDYF